MKKINIEDEMRKRDIQTGDSQTRMILLLCRSNIKTINGDVGINTIADALSLAHKIHDLVKLAKKHDLYGHEAASDNVKYDGNKFYIGYNLYNLVYKNGRENWDRVFLRLHRIKKYLETQE